MIIKVQLTDNLEYVEIKGVKIDINKYKVIEINKKKYIEIIV